MAKSKLTKLQKTKLQRVNRKIAAQWAQEEALRKAEVCYITDEQKRPAEFWWQQLCADLIPLNVLMARCQETKWVERRDRFWSEVTGEILRKAKYRAVQDRVGELQQIQTVRDNTLELLTPEVINQRKVFRVAPKSYEGLLRALVAVDQLADRKRDDILAMIEPELARTEAGKDMGAGQGEFDPEEYRKVATMLLEQRRSQQLRGQGEIIDAESVTEEPDE